MKLTEYCQGAYAHGLNLLPWSEEPRCHPIECNIILAALKKLWRAHCSASANVKRNLETWKTLLRDESCVTKVKEATCFSRYLLKTPLLPRQSVGLGQTKIMG